MKTCLKQIFTAVTASLILAGCSNLNQVEHKNEKCQVSVQFENGGLTRQINPDDYTDEELSNFKFNLIGKSTFGHSYSKENLAFTAKKASIAIEYAPWELTLTAYKEVGEGADKTFVPVLMGNTAVDLTNGGALIKFILTTANLSTAGGVDLDCEYETTDGITANIEKIKVGIYDRLTKEVINETKINPPDDNNFTYECDSLSPDTYTFMVTFYGDAEATKVIGLWSDTITVAPGNITSRKGTNKISIPNVIMEKPAAPQNLKAYYVANSEKDEFYKVKLTWEDKSTNEENFIITLKEYTSNGDANPTTYKILGVEEDATKNKEIFFTSNTRVSGSIVANNKEAVIILPTGKLFDVSIQSYNFAGSSDVCARVDSSSETNGIAIANDKRINKLLITYLFPAAALKTATKTYYGIFTEYKEWAADESAFNLYTINTIASGSKPNLIDNANHEWKKWLDTEGNEATQHETFENATYIAEFNLTYPVEYDVEKFKSFKDGEVTISVADGGSAKNTDKINIAVTGDYDYYQVDFNGSVMYYGPTSTFAFTPGTSVVGTKTISVMAKVKGTINTWVGQSITVDFQN